MSSNLIYSTRSPSGKEYIGLTSMTVAKRWGAHVTRANRSSARHPLSDAIRYYGADAFELSVLEDGLTREQAGEAEKRWIAARNSIAPFGYNVSPGGETDGATGAARFREMLEDPEFRQRYLERLGEACRARGMWPGLLDAAAQWRSDNPQAAWRIAFRASRVAACGRDRSDPRFGAWGRLHIPGREVAAARRAYFTRGRTRQQWARRTKREVADLASKIGASLRVHHAANPEAIKATLRETRKRIDRNHQAARASAGLKAWWADLRKDPERYAAYIDSRKRFKCAPAPTTS